MDNPCTKDCPDRKPGCNCEKRKAYKWQQDQIKEAKKRDRLPDMYRNEKIRSSRLPYRKRRKWDE